MTQIAFMGFGGNKGQRQECGGPKRQKGGVYFQIKFFLFNGEERSVYFPLTQNF